MAPVGQLQQACCRGTRLEQPTQFVDQTPVERFRAGPDAALGQRLDRRRIEMPAAGHALLEGGVEVVDQSSSRALPAAVKGSIGDHMPDRGRRWPGPS